MHWFRKRKRVKHFTSPSGEGKESGLNPVPGAALIPGQTVKLEPGPTQWERKLYFCEKRCICLTFLDCY